MSTLERIRFDGQVAVVTGAGNGLGRCHALEFARRGALVLVNDVGCTVHGKGASRTVADAVVQEIRAFGGVAAPSYCDISSSYGGSAVVEEAIEAFGRIDILVNSAGILDNAPFEELSEAQIAEGIATNLLGVTFACQAAYRRMREQRFGRIILTSSAAGLFGSRNQANYTSAKAGLVGLARTLAMEGDDHGIHTNVIAPTAITRMAGGIRPQDIEMDDLAAGDARGTELPSGPEFVTPLVIFLASAGCRENGAVFSAAKGRFARVYTAITEGWQGPSSQPAAPEEIAAHMAAIQDIAHLHLPRSVYAELALIQRGTSQAARPEN